MVNSEPVNEWFIDGWQLGDTPRQLTLSDCEQLEQGCWYHCQRDAAGLKQWLSRVGVPSSLVSALLADDTRPRFEPLGEDTFLLIVRGINLNKGNNPDDMLSIRFLYFKGCLISTRKYPSRAIAEARRQCEEGNSPPSLLAMLVTIIDKLNRNIETFLDPIEEDIEFYAEHQDEADSQSLANLNKRLLKIRRFLTPQRYALDDLLQSEIAGLDALRMPLLNCRDLVVRINESINFYIDQIQVINQHLGQVQSEKVNRNTYLISMISIIFLPISFLTGLLGVNIGGMPGVDSSTAFWLFCIALLAVTVFEIILFRRMKFI
ncbi:CorA family divalent cation transporter [Photobacterium halotolerans]|uniref:Zinc transporter ZntB n=1 Tax=Photobacterium halotolerans TaxID=265726 RepID=A0A7X4WR45_9GAMM|nr:CorA family divalent cation transporter [Photobacterium halotolerans]NAW64027.1 zinc transporter ZntB [Photobacterium halotolerans]NAW87342.1 zinc transporter ZntB [Photobacterium halotolerans]